MELVTGRTGTPHVTSQQDRQLHQGVWGADAYILNTGNLLEASAVSSNLIQIKDGALMYQGALFSVKVNTVDEITIENGTQGMLRKDLICIRYTYDSSANTEAAEWVVIQGESVESNPVQPACTSGDIQQGDSTVDCPVFVVNLNGINIESVDTIPDVIQTLPELIGNFTDLQDQVDNMSDPNWYTWIAFQARDIPTGNYLLVDSVDANTEIVTATADSSRLAFNSAGRYLLIVRLSVQTDNPSATLDLYMQNSNSEYEQYRSFGTVRYRGQWSFSTVIGVSSAGQRYALRITNNSENTVTIGSGTSLCVAPLF